MQEEIRGKDLMQQFKPAIAIMVYKSELDNYYLESHSVSEEGQILEGKPLLQETLQGVVDVFFDERKNSVDLKGFIPENVLSYRPQPGGKYIFTWYRKAEKRVLHFSGSTTGGEAWIPPMLYHTDGKRLYVFAMLLNKRPIATTKLCLAPYSNTSNDGLVCLGNAKLKKPTKLTYTSLITYWESLFWMSEFTGGSAYWTKLIKSKGKLKYDTRTLKPSKTKISELL